MSSWCYPQFDFGVNIGLAQIQFESMALCLMFLIIMINQILDNSDWSSTTIWEWNISILVHFDDSIGMLQQQNGKSSCFSVTCDSHSYVCFQIESVSIVRDIRMFSGIHWLHQREFLLNWLIMFVQNHQRVSKLYLSWCFNSF